MNTLFDLLWKLNVYHEDEHYDMPEHERLNYWFRPQEKKKLAYLATKIARIQENDLRLFFSCGLSHILKNSSIWLQKSNKPTRDLKKKPSDPFTSFTKQIKTMMRGNNAFFHMLQSKGYSEVQCDIHCADARKIPVDSESVTLLVTSPPYVTSYQYADLHQLTALWFDYTNDLSQFRKQFIGTLHTTKNNLHLNSNLADSIIDRLKDKDRKISQDVAIYFADMNDVFGEMRRILKKGGRACIVIGNTHLKGVLILNAEVYVEQLTTIGFVIDNVIKRHILSKTLPSTRDAQTGRFTKSTNHTKILIYPTEYILVARKV